ncbi:MAG: hypothetical protein QOE56_1403 [Solirubrobacterales bacterium]|jgi:hypothetical protein|nr:hypothetical protein [Solirubrobacterales bacterium]
MATTTDRGPTAGADGSVSSPVRSPWLGVEPGVDPVRWARVLRRAHKLALSKGVPPSVLRSVIANSWQRATAQGVDPDGYAPTMLDEAETDRALGRHPVGHLLPEIERMLREATEDARYFAVLSDADGVLLWVDGHSKALDTAIEPGFLPGHLCSEQVVGTNAVGTALVLDHPVQIFSAEHFNRRLHVLTCSAAPIRDPETGHTIAALNLSGNFRTGHPHSLTLVSTVARVVEEILARELTTRDERLKQRYIDLIARGGLEHSALVSRSGRVLASSPRGWLGSRLRQGGDGSLVLPNGAEIDEEPIGPRGEAFLVRTSRRRASPPRPTIAVRALGPRRARVTIGDWSAELSPRHSEILMLLALHPRGLSCEELRSRIYGTGTKTVTARAEISRLRRLIGPALESNPYRLAGRVRADRAALERCLG